MAPDVHPHVFSAIDERVALGLRYPLDAYVSVGREFRAAHGMGPKKELVWVWIVVSVTLAVDSWRNLP